MKNYVFEYYIGGVPANDKGAVAAWFAGLGDKLVDAGNPFNSNGMAVEPGGVAAITNHPAVGYSIVKATNMDEAVAMAKGCPILKQEKSAVRVYETLPM